jgi:hypothetical protein
VIYSFHQCNTTRQHFVATISLQSLFLGEYAYLDYRYPLSGEARPKLAGRLRRSVEDYKEEGTTFYKLTREHKIARDFLI